MRAAIFDAPGQPLRVAVTPDPEPEAGEVLLRTHSCGICGSDLHMTEGHGMTFPNGTVLGHEYSGEVVALGADVSTLAIGDRVAVLPVMSCGRCEACLGGRPARCSQRSIVGCGGPTGGYAEYTRAQASGCLKLPDRLTYDDGALIEPLAVALRGVSMARMRPGARVVVLGAGPIGLGAIYWARRLGAGRIVTVAASRRRETMAIDMGSDAFQLAEDAAGAVAEALGGEPDVVFECSGQPGMIAAAIDHVAPGGTIIVLGACGAPDSFFPPAALVKEASLRFSFMYDLQDYQGALAALSAGALDPRRMITGHVGLDDLPATFEALRGRTDHCKVIITPGAKTP
jgi:threonine dehydrogenase-like Zn-dependent dehydrogenase